jgi:hypothetical protein
MGQFEGFFEAPSKNPSNCPIMSFAQENKIISPTFQISVTLVILCPKERERDRDREREKEREREQEQDREQDREQEREQEREREQEQE